MKDGYKELARAIVVFAARDWAFSTKAMMNCDEYKRRDITKKKDTEKFFRSEWCEMLSGIEGSIILNRLKKENLDSIIKRTRNCIC